MNIPSEVEGRIPLVLADAIKKGINEIEVADGIWQLELEVPPDFLAKELPSDSLLIGNNECGDYLFLQDDGKGTWVDSDRVGIYWHEGPEIQTPDGKLKDLLFPPAAVPTPGVEVKYFEGDTRVLLGDLVENRFLLLFKSQWTVTYVPGISPRKAEMEFNRLMWVGLQKLNSRVETGFLVDPKTHRLKKSIRFLTRHG